MVSLFLTRVLSRVLDGVGSTGPVTFAVVSLLLAAATLAATYLPAQHATSEYPMLALRHEWAEERGNRDPRFA